MSDTSRIDIVTVDLSKPLQREKYGALLATGDENANRFGAHIVRNGATVDVSGCTVSGSFIRADGVTVPLEGVAEGNTVYVDLHVQCYAVDGVFSLSLRISGEGYAQTIRVVDGYIRRTDTGVYIDPDETVYNTEELKAVMMELDGIENPGSADTMLAGTEMIGADGKKVTGTIETIGPNYSWPAVSFSNGSAHASFTLPHGKYISNPENVTVTTVKSIPAKNITITPNAAGQIVEAGDGDLINKVTVKGDTNLVADNIKYGVSIFGVEGMLATGVNDELICNNAATSLSAYCYYRINSFVNIEFTRVRTVNERAFIGCSNMESVDFSGTTSTYGCNKIAARAFSGCYRLKTVIIRNPTITGTFESDAFDGCCHFNGTAQEIYKRGYDEDGLWYETVIDTINPDCAKDGYIYVPSALVADYQTLLPDYATQFRALEDYTVDGTTTGALDETKI